MKVSFLLVALLLAVVAAGSEQLEKDGGGARKCSARAGDNECSRSDGAQSSSSSSSGQARSRRKRTVTLPNSSFLVLQSRLTVPQPPVGLYIVWVRVRFVVRSMFTEATVQTNDGGAGTIFGRRSFDNVLTRTLADDQVDILGRMESALDKSGMPGRQCVLRAICELKETPIHHWSLVGEMITTLMFPKADNHTQLDDYKKAADIGEQHGDCWSFYPLCPISVFNVLPDIYTEAERFNVTIDDFGAGSDFAEKPEGEENVKNIHLDLDLSP